MSEVENAQNLYGEKGGTGRCGQYSELAAELAGFDGVVVGVMSDARFAGREVPAKLDFRHFAAEWGSIPRVKVVPLDSDQIRSYAILFKGKLDILVFPYGSIYPMEAFSLYSGQSFNYFLKRGGAVLTTGGIPFASQANPFGKVMDTGTPAKLTEVFDKWISKFGIKYYQCSVKPHVERCDSGLLPALPSDSTWTPSSTGLVIVNSTHEPVPKPSAGNVFPERTPARTVIPLIRGFDRWGQELCISAALAQDFENGSRRIHFTHESGPHPLDPDSARFRGLMQDLFTLLSNRVFVKDVEAGYACYRQGEEVELRLELASFERETVAVTVVIEINGATGTTAHRIEEEVEVKQSRSTRMAWKWAPGMFAEDEYNFKVTLIRGNQAVSSATNGFVVWNEEIVRNGPSIGITGGYMSLNGAETVLCGTNYYESTRGEAMWFRPDVANIIRDHRRMQECGVRMIRPHYHHLKWFKDYLEYHHAGLPEFYSELAGDIGAMPDERVWRIWDMFIFLAQKYGIVYNGDLFTLVPEEMGDPRGWFGTVEAVYDRRRRPAQKAFLLALDRRYRNVPGITWDLFNEPYMVTDEVVAEWAADLSSVLEADGSKRLITVGGVANLPWGVDYDSQHGGIGSTFRKKSARPVLLQELHFDRPESLDAELQQREGFRRMAVITLHTGCAGWMPWSWTRQMRLWQDTFEHHHTFPMEKWDDRLGMHTHEDGTLKPAGLLFKDMAILLSGIRPVNHDPDTHLITTTDGVLATRVEDENGSGLEILHRTGGRCLACMARDSIQLDGRILVKGPAGSYIFVRAGAAGFDGASQLLVKSECPGELSIHRGGLRSVELVDPAGDTCRILTPVDSKETAGIVNITIDPSMTLYWLRMKFA